MEIAVRTGHRNTSVALESGVNPRTLAQILQRIPIKLASQAQNRWSSDASTKQQSIVYGVGLT